MFPDGCRLLSSNSQEPAADTVEVEEETDGSQDFEINLQSQVALVPDREKKRVKKNLFGAGPGMNINNLCIPKGIFLLRFLNFTSFI